MISNDIRLKKEEMELLKSIVNKKIITIMHDQFAFVNSSSQVVQINCEKEIFYLYSFTESLDYFGAKEDVAVWTFEKKRYKMVDQKNFIETPFNQKVRSISIIQENQCLFKDNVQLYDNWLTRGIIFDFGDRQLSLEKAIWFSEDIYIQRGYNLIDKFSSTDEFVKDWDKEYKATCTRDIVILK